MSRRYQELYRPLSARTVNGHRRHLFRGSGDSGFPTSLCQDAQWTAALADDVAVPACRTCRLIALTELSLAADRLGLLAEAALIAGRVNDESFETPAAQTA